MRNAGLDGLRLVAVLLVLGRHLWPNWPKDSPLADVLTALTRGGWVGVDLFFVLSGFLVSGLLFAEHQKNGSVNAVRFLIRRGFKIYPAFWYFLLITCGVLVLAGHPPSAENFLGELFFLQNYAGRMWGHTWSLAIEEHFYFALAILFALAGRLRLIPLACIAVLVICFFLRVATWQFGLEYDDRTHLFPTHLRVDSLVAGVLLCYALHYWRLKHLLRNVPTWVFATVGASLLAPAFIFPLKSTWWIPVFGYNLFYLGAALLTFGAYRMKLKPGRITRALNEFGASSYSMYLWHLPVNVWVAPIILLSFEITNYWAYAAIFVLGTMLWGWAMANVVEKPFLRLRDRVIPSLRAHELRAT